MSYGREKHKFEGQGGSGKALGRNKMVAEKTPGITNRVPSRTKDTNYHCWTLSRFTQQAEALKTGLAGRGRFSIRMCTFVPKELKNNKAAALFFTLTPKAPQILIIHNRFAESKLLQNGLSKFTLENTNVNSSKNVATQTWLHYNSIVHFSYTGNSQCLLSGWY